MDAAMPKLPTLSYSALNAYQVCPRRFWHMYIAKDLPREEKSKEQIEGTNVHEALKRRIRLNEPLPKEYEAYESIAREIFDQPHVKYTELKLGMTADGRACDFFDDNVWLRGALDLVLSGIQAPTTDQNRLSKAVPHALLIDWKTGKVREDPGELAIQALLLKAKWPELVTVTGAYVWLRERRVGALHDVSNTSNTWLSVQRTAGLIADRTAHDDWPPDEGPLCGYCPVTKAMCEFKRERK